MRVLDTRISFPYVRGKEGFLTRGKEMSSISQGHQSPNELFKSTVSYYGLSLTKAASVLSMTRQTMGNIFSSPPRSKAKPYLAHALVAGVNGLSPLSPEETLEYIDDLGVGRQVAHNWRNGINKIPAQACLAAAFYKAHEEAYAEDQTP